MLRVVLTVGNTLNHGTSRGSADGLKLESLQKLADMKVSLPSFKAAPCINPQSVLFACKLSPCRDIPFLLSAVPQWLRLPHLLWNVYFDVWMSQPSNS